MGRRSGHMLQRQLLRCVAAASAVTLLGACGAREAPPRPGFDATEGTAENPHARAEHEWMQLRDPRTGSIPRDIGARENEYAVRIAAQAQAAGAPPMCRNWVARGPANIGGRTKALAIDATNEDVIVAGGVSSGMWKSADGGSTWRKTTAATQLHSVSCIVQNTAAGKQNVWYYGTGEYSGGRGSSAAGPMMTNAFFRGDGIFKSTNGAESWTLLASTASGTPTRSDAFDFVWGLATFGTDGVYAATSTGLWKSSDAGGSWQHVLDFGEAYPSTEVAVSPNGTVWATIGGDGPAAAIYRSTDGVHWDKLQPPGWPAKTLRTVIGLVPSNPNTVFFWTAEDEPQQLRTHLYRYVEGGPWTDLRPNLPWGGDITTYAAGMLVLKVKPDDENTIFIGAMNLHRSTDGGQSWLLVDDLTTWGRFHVDQHSLAFYPSNPRRMIAGNDGGLFRTEDNLTSLGQYQQIDWQPLNNGYLTSQFYTVAVDHGTPGSPMVAGGMQDNGCMFTSSADPAEAWRLLVWGDGGYMAITDGAQYVYTSLGATLGVYRNAFVGSTVQVTEVTPTAAKMGLWMNPMILDAHDSRIMYLPASDELWRNSDLTQIPYVFPSHRTDLNWTKLANVHEWISALAMSGAMPPTLYYGTINGKVFRLDNPQSGQPVPVPLPTTGLPPSAYVQCIAVDPRDNDRLLVVFPNYGVVSICASDDGGQHWQGVAGNLEEFPNGSGDGPSVRWVAILYVENHPVYFAGTSVGLFSTSALDGMSTVWVKEGGTAIGNIVVDMIDVRQSDGYVAVGTHGNGVFTTAVTALPGPTIRRHLRPAL
jgi:hypothetical protein